MEGRMGERERMKYATMKKKEKKKMLKRGKAFLISKEPSDRTCYFSDYPNGSKSLFPLLVFIPFPRDLKIRYLTYLR